MDTRTLLKLPYKTNARVIQMQAKGLSHEDSLLQPESRGNCFNWVLGHILAYRNTALEMLGEERFWTDDEAQRYYYDSEPVTSADDPDIYDFEMMLGLLETTTEQISAAIDAAPDSLLIETNEKGKAMQDRLMFNAWHESYHTGQAEYLRQLAGTEDKVI